MNRLPALLPTALRRLLLALALLAPAAMAGAQDRETATFGAWVVRCEPREGLPPCDMHQAVRTQDGKVALEVTLGYQPDERRYLLRAELPLGFLLPPGVAIRVDEELEFRELVVTRCLQRGCLAEGRPSEELIAALRQGTAAQFLVVTPVGRGLALPFSLQGFAGALEELVARNEAS